MELHEVTARKKAMDSDIREVIQAFIRDTGLTVSRVDLDVMSVAPLADPGRRYVIAVCTTVEVR